MRSLRPFVCCALSDERVADMRCRVAFPPPRSPSAAEIAEVLEKQQVPTGQRSAQVSAMSSHLLEQVLSSNPLSSMTTSDKSLVWANRFSIMHRPGIL